MNEYDVIVIGGGLLGCFVARNLARYKLKIALLEKREDLCTGISRANTAIIYSGCDTKPGTLKTSMCVRSAQEFSLLCDELGVRYSRCGSIMVSFGERGADVLRNKLETGIENGVRGMRLLTREDVLELEPNIATNVHSGLYVPDTGTVMPWELCLAAAENAAVNGVKIMLNTEVTAIARNVQSNAECGMRNAELRSEGAAQGAGSGSQGSGDESTELSSFAGTNKSYFYDLLSSDLILESDDKFMNEARYLISTNIGTFFARGVINCAGMSADGVFEMLFEPTVRIVPSAGDYFILDTKASGHIKHVIFHEPEVKDKGLTLVPTVDGNILIGPTERPGDDFETTGAGLAELRELIAQVIPTLPLEHIIRSFGAVRPNPHMLRASAEPNAKCVMRNAGLGNEGDGDAGSSRKWKVVSCKLGTSDTDDVYVLDDKSVSDFCIVESDGGAFISLVGVKTPGLTCANELGVYVADKVASYLGAALNPAFDPKRIAPARLCDMSFDERESQSKSKDPCYSRIVCRCRGISEGEIVNAIHRFPGASTLDGVKRRTGAGSGRCQSGFCGQRVIELLARELGCLPEKITKDGEGSYFFSEKV